LSLEAWVLYGLVFLWQFPHFMAIAWMYREDYERAGYLVLPRGNARVPFVVLETILPLVALVAVSVMQTPEVRATTFYLVVILLGLGFFYFGLNFVYSRSRGTRTPTARGIDRLPSLVVCAERDTVQLGPVMIRSLPNTKV
jgi:heme o synthase